HKYKRIVKAVVKDKICKVEGCQNPMNARGLCDKHYYQVKIHNRLTPELERPVRRTCIVEGCDKKHHGLGLCDKHYRQMKRNNEISDKNPGRGCSVEGCNGKHKAKGLCANHYQTAYNEMKRFEEKYGLSVQLVK
ncbi:hypothetical protein ACQUY5_32485, partial [Bacillus cereus]